MPMIDLSTQNITRKSVVACACLLSAVTLICTSAQVSAASLISSKVLDVRLGQVPGRTRLVFDLSEPTAFQLTKLEEPKRLVIQLSGASSEFDHKAVSVYGTPIKRIEASQKADAPLRYVLNVQEEVTPRLYALGPNVQHGHRLVLDLYQPSASASTEPTKHASNQQEAIAATIAANTDRNSEPRRKLPPSPRSATKTETLPEEAPQGELSGYISVDARLFANDPKYTGQDDHNASIAVEPEYYIDWADGAQRFAFRPFARYDTNDDERSHIDIRELYWRLEHNDFIVKLGLDVVFWGVAESQHLIDVINQTDFVENIDGEDKLGQPMLNIDYATQWGTLQAYVLPYFRERTFPGENGRLRTNPVVDTDDALYESGDEEKHIDFALRWSHYFGDWDVGLAHFSGTTRTPALLARGEGENSRLLPYYFQIEQTSLDIQATKGAWLWKLEALYNSNHLEDFYAAVGGFEYTWFGAINEVADLGWLLEYHFDERDDRALTPLQEDLFLGVRYTGNDIAGTRLLAGVVVDTDSQSTFGNLEAVRRLGENWTLTFEARIFSNIERNDLLRYWEDDDYIELQLSRYF